MRKYLEDNLNWKVYSIDEVSGIVACDFIDMEFNLFYDGTDYLDLPYKGELGDIALKQAKSRIINDILDFLQDKIDGVHRSVYNAETGMIDNFTWKVTES